CIVVPERWMPFILPTAKGGNVDISGKITGTFILRIIERHLNLMRLLLIAIHQHDRPLVIWAQHRVSRHHRMMRAIAVAPGCWIDYMLPSIMLKPFKIDHAAGKVLR